jgi:DNA primase
MAAHIPREFIDEVLRRIDVVDVVSDALPLKKSGSNYLGLCPFHNEKSPSFTVSQDKQFYHCFGCGAHGNAVTFLMEHERLGFVEAIHDLAARTGLKVPVSTTNSETPQRASVDAELYETLDAADQYFRRQLREHPKAQEAVDYLKRRGLTGEIAKRFHLGYAPPGWDNLLHALGTSASMRERLALVGLIIKREDEDRHYDRFRHRIMFPIHDRRGRVVGFGGRVLSDETPKYLNSPESPVFHKGQELYGLYQARQADPHLERVLVVEGYMDVIALAQFGFTSAVATLGTALTPAHVERLFRATHRVIYCFDGDEAGRRAAWRAVEHTLAAMGEGRQAGFLFLPEHDDPDSLIRREGADGFSARLDAATPLSTFFFDKLQRDTDMGTVDGRARLVELAKPLLSNIPDGAFKVMMMDELAKRARIGNEALSRLWGVRSATTRMESPVAAQRKVTKSAGLTPMRLAIAIVLQNPAIAARVADTAWLSHCDQAGAPLLKGLLDLLREQPHLTTGALLEHWRGHAEGEHLGRLAAWPLPLPPAQMESDFHGALKLLHSQLNARRLDDLLQKPLETLSPEERLELLQKLGGGGKQPAP